MTFAISADRSENLLVKVIITSMYLVGIYEFNITKYISIGL